MTHSRALKHVFGIVLMAAIEVRASFECAMDVLCERDMGGEARRYDARGKA
jgi:hypothetical protein